MTYFAESSMAQLLSTWPGSLKVPSWDKWEMVVIGVEAEKKGGCLGTTVLSKDPGPFPCTPPPPGIHRPALETPGVQHCPPRPQAPSFPRMFIHWAAFSEPNPQPCSDMPASSPVRVASRGPWPLHPLPAALPFCITTTPSPGPHPIWFRRCCCTQTFLPTQSCLPLHRVLTAP